MAEEQQVFRVRPDGAVEMVAALVAVLRQQRVKAVRHGAVDRLNAGIPVGRSLQPALGVVIQRLVRPGLRWKVPAEALGIIDRRDRIARVEFAQPRQDLRLLTDGPERQGRGVSGPSERRRVIKCVPDLRQTMA